MPKATTPSLSNKRRHNPLEDDLLATGVLKNREGRPSKRADRKQAEEQAYVDAKSSRKILAMSRELIDEEELQSGARDTAVPTTSAFDFDPSRSGEGSEPDEEEFANEEVWGDEEDVVEEIEVDAADLETFNRFITPTMNDDPLLTHGWDGKPGDGSEGQAPGTNLADLIMAKIAEKEAMQSGRQEDRNPVEEDYELPPKVVEVFTKIGLILARYKSGPLPKPFKILPQIPHWEDILQLTRPDSWTPNACYAATRIFVSAKPLVVQRFMEMVILERVREDIYENKKLNVHLFNCLKRALYKPAGFFKGFLFPLAASGTCTLREAQIVSAVLARVSIPVLHSAAAIKTLCDIAAEQASQHSECVSATNYMLKVLLEKRYALPWQCVDSLVFHFLRYAAAAREGDAAPKALPVIFHQCMLVFAQRYRNDITEDQREALLDLLLNHGHDKIAPEIRRELLAGRGRGVPIEKPGPAFDGDDTMLVDS
ncbi:Bystin-domain-containing protein [Parathielavia appendiculata]|uniref:Bystin-domain-containing protein n=1 Tax=Parathielavia appendiculata TaxID=2587402 RepID=A0AAN6U486_9PEZI|nr:Bystin-domain-containing protein [Parathielavia appendiculata]